MNLVTTCQPMNGGADAAAGRGMNFNLTLSGSWAIGDLISLTFTDALTALQTLIGAGFVSGVAPSYVFTFKDKIYALARSSMYFTAVGSALIWNDPNAAGNGFLTLSNSFGISEDLQAVGVFQGKLAVASRNTVQVWTVDPDPALNAGGQVLSNIGTFAKDSLQSIGDRDVIMLHDSGFRSLRPRDASSNASVEDIGTPVDSFVQSALQTLTDAERAAACAVVEPSANRYWCYLPNKSTTPNLIPNGAQYDVSAVYTLTGLTANRTYRLTIGANESANFVNGTQIFSGSQTFIAQGTELTLVGVGTVPVTASVVLLPPSDIWVHSSFPSSEVEAWSTYTPSYSKGEASPAYVISPAQYFGTGAGYEPTVMINYNQTAYYTGLTVGATYQWTKGTNDYKLNYGSGVLFDTGTFVATQTTCYSMGNYTGLNATITGILTGFASGASVTTSYSLASFVPDKFAVYLGKVYCRAGDNIFLYGGQSGTVYDACILNGRIPYLDCDSPTTPKDFSAMDAAFQGTWNIKVGTNYDTEAFTSVFANTVPTFRNPRIPINRKATHISLDFTETGSSYARFANAMIHFRMLKGR